MQPDFCALLRCTPAVHRPVVTTASGEGCKRLRALASIFCMLVLVGCTIPKVKSSDPVQPVDATAASQQPQPEPPAHDSRRHSPEPPPNPNLGSQQLLLTEPLKTVLHYGDQVRMLGSNEVNREITRLNPLAEKAAPDVQAQYQLQLALALAQTRNMPDLVRAIGLTQRVQEVRNPATLELQPLARLLQQRLTEQRRADELNDRQAQLLRDTQRRLEAAQDRLEALKAIERSLYNNRGNAGSAAHSHIVSP